MYCNLSRDTATFCDIKYQPFSVDTTYASFSTPFNPLWFTNVSESAKLAKQRLVHRERVQLIVWSASDERTEIPPISCRILTNGPTVGRLSEYIHATTYLLLRRRSIRVRFRNSSEFKFERIIRGVKPFPLPVHARLSR
jgi:hypothetical protein